MLISTLHSRDFTNQLWRRHNAKSENTVLSDNGEMTDRWLFLAEWYVQDMHKDKCIRNTMIRSLPWITIFVALEVICQWFLQAQNSYSW